MGPINVWIYCLHKYLPIELWNIFVSIIYSWILWIYLYLQKKCKCLDKFIQILQRKISYVLSKYTSLQDFNIIKKKITSEHINIFVRVNIKKKNKKKLWIYAQYKRHQICEGINVFIQISEYLLHITLANSWQFKDFFFRILI